jgi:hypothetical protein
MRRKLPLLIFVIIVSTQILSAQINRISLVTKKPLRYQKTDFDIQLNAQWENPYLQEDIALDMLLTSPSGKKLKLPCYYESGNSGQISTWKARFAPQEIGLYKYMLQLSKAGKVVQTAKVNAFTAYASAKNGFLHLGDNWAFRFDNGKPFRGVGENICWESRSNDDSKYFKALHEMPKYNYEYLLRALKNHGGNYYRTWISAFNLPLDWHRNFNSNRYEPSDAYYNPSAIKKIDRMFNLADSLGLYVMLTLGPGNYSTRDGGFSPSAADFFVNPKSKARYKNRLRYFIARWGYSTSVGAWEFFNEVDNVQFGNRSKPISADSIVSWHDEMSTYLKATDPYQHLVTTSISHRDLKGLNSLPNIDFNQKHIYKNTASMPKAIVQYEKEFNKPYVIGEFSYEWDWSKNFDEFPEEMDSDFKRGLWYGLFAPTPVLPMSWWWEYFDNRKTDVYIQRVRTISDKMLAAGLGKFEQIHSVASDTSIVTYGVKCGKQTYIYAYNSQAAAKYFTLHCNTRLLAKGINSYICETGIFKPVPAKAVTVKDNMLTWNLPAKTDVVFIITDSKQAKYTGK